MSICEGMDPVAIDSAIDRAIDFFGLEVMLKEQQRELLRVFLSGKNVFIAFPTGFGKCFALIPVVFDVHAALEVIDNQLL